MFETIGGCIRPNDSFILKEPIFQNVTSVSLTLLAVISHLKWSSVNVIYDDFTALEAEKLHDDLSVIGTFVVMLHMRSLTSQKIDTLMDLKRQANDETSLNSTILCRLDTCRHYLEKPFNYNRKHVLRSSLLHNSRWLLGIFHDGNISNLETNSTALDNVAVIKYPVSLLSVSNENRNLNIDDNQECAWIPIETLMWTKGRTRSFSTVGYTHLNGRLLTQKNIFPNAAMGFNGRQLTVSTLPWKPFVRFYNETQNYSGYTIDVLCELAHRLNFTYEITRPDDKQWGIEVGDGTWTGLVGQLQRREVDLVAAPLTIQTDRERVMDFPHPYFYDATVILLKRPDPWDLKWKTLIDPFHPYVLICILISLPISSFFLFFFEKNNPYYRNVEGRMINRGLHHFSDSFWYLYGALLTQGGEHLAESFSGRTMLSFFWIFSIIMMAAYSGNFIAFLTVEKDKVPINNIDDLISQDTYKWGIQGKTAYETIFKESELPEYKLFWSKVIEFNQTDPTVLSGDEDRQFKKVMNGNYAYVVERTTMEFAMVDKCRTGIYVAASDILPTQYSFGLPNNSPYTKMFTDELISIHESGLLQIWKINHWPKPRFCKGTLPRKPNQITLIDIHSSFYMIAIGIFLAFVSLFGEFTKRKYCKWRERQKDVYLMQAAVTHLSTNSREDEFTSSNKDTSNEIVTLGKYPVEI